MLSRRQLKRKLSSALFPPCIFRDESRIYQTTATLVVRGALEGALSSFHSSNFSTVKIKVAKDEGVLASQIIQENMSTNEEEKEKNVYVLHGLMGQGKNWRGPIKVLSEKLKEVLPKVRFRFHLIDIRGHGNSPRFHDYAPHTIENAAKDIERYSKYHEIVPDVVIGHSLGGKIALEYSRSLSSLSSAKKRQLVFTLDSVPYEVEKDMFGAEFILKATEKLPEIVPNREYLRAQLAPLQISSGVIDWLGSNLVLAKQGDARDDDGTNKTGLTWQFNRKIMRELYESFQQTALWHALEEKDHDNVHVYIVKAEKSAEWKPDAMKRIETLKQEKKISYHVLEKAGHWVHSDNPTGLINILHDELVAAENNSTI